MVFSHIIAVTIDPNDNDDSYYSCHSSHSAMVTYDSSDVRIRVMLASKIYLGSPRCLNVSIGTWRAGRTRAMWILPSTDIRTGSSKFNISVSTSKRKYVPAFSTLIILRVLSSSTIIMSTLNVSAV